MPRASAKKRVQKELDHFEQRLSRDISPFSDTSKEAIRQRWKECGNDTSAFMKQYTPHYRLDDNGDPIPDAVFHSDLDAMMNYPEQAFFYLHGPREHAKSVRCRLNLFRQVLNGDIQYFVIAAETIDKAWDHIEYIEFELLNNHRIASDFEVDIRKSDSNKGDFKCKVKNKGTGKSNYFMLDAVGEGTSGKGLTFLQYRPQGALVDDLEKTKDTYNRDNGQKKVNFVKQELYGAISGGPLVWLGNMGRKDSALHIAFEEQYEKERLEELKEGGTPPGEFARQCDRNGGRYPTEDELEVIKGFIYRADTKPKNKPVQYLWPERFDPSWYQSKRRILGWRYEGEYNGNPVNPGKIFNTFPTYHTIPEKAIWFTWFDPAWGKTKSSSHKCWIVGAYDGHYFYIVDAYCKAGFPISEAIDRWYQAFEKYEPRGLMEGGYEDAYDQENRMSSTLDDAEDYHGVQLPVYGIKNPGQKDVRISSIEYVVNGRKEQDDGRVLWPEDLNDDLQEGKNQMEIYDPLLNSIPKDFPDGLAALITELRQRWRNHSSSGYTSLGKRRYQRSGRRY